MYKYIANHDEMSDEERWQRGDLDLFGRVPAEEKLPNPFLGNGPVEPRFVPIAGGSIVVNLGSPNVTTDSIEFVRDPLDSRPRLNNEEMGSVIGGVLGLVTEVGVGTYLLLGRTTNLIAATRAVISVTPSVASLVPAVFFGRTYLTIANIPTFCLFPTIGQKLGRVVDLAKRACCPRRLQRPRN